MSAYFRNARTLAVAAGVAGALGFGASSALATPDPPVSCESPACNIYCEARYGPFAAGYCGENGECQCAV